MTTEDKKIRWKKKDNSRKG